MKSFLLLLGTLITCNAIAGINAYHHIDAIKFSRKSDGPRVRTQIDSNKKRLAYIKENSWVMYSDVDFEDGALSVVFKIAGEYDGEIDIILDKASNSPVATVKIPPTGGWDNWRYVYSSISPIIKGKHDVILMFKKHGFDIDSFVFFKTLDRQPEAFLNSFNKIKAVCFNDMYGILSENCNDYDSGSNIGWIDEGDWVKFERVNIGPLATTLLLRVAGMNEGEINVIFDSLSYPPITTLKIPATGGWQNWRTLVFDIPDVAGVHDVYLQFPKGGFNINWFRFSDDTNLIDKIFTDRISIRTAIKDFWNFFKLKEINGTPVVTCVERSHMQYTLEAVFHRIKKYYIRVKKYRESKNEDLNEVNHSLIELKNRKKDLLNVLNNMLKKGNADNIERLKFDLNNLSKKTFDIY